MALIKCRECGSEVSSLAPACPRCGCPTQTSFVPSAPPPARKIKAKPSTFKSCLGCLGGIAAILAVILIASLVYSNGLKKEFAANREQILKQVKAAADAHDDKKVVELAGKYDILEDPELKKYLDPSRAVLKAQEDKAQAAQAKADAIKRDAEAREDAKRQEAQAKADAIAEARRRPDPRRSRIYQDSWLIGYAAGEKARQNGEHPIGQYIQMEALNAGQGIYQSPMDQMEFASGYTDGYGRGYGQ